MAPQTTRPRPAAHTTTKPTSAKPSQQTASRPAPAQARKSKFTYQDDPEEVVSAHASAAGGAWDSIFDSQFPVFRPKEGENNIRILPRTFDAKALGVDPHWGFPVFVHSRIGPDGSSYLCRRLMHNEHCGLCEERRMVGGDADAQKALRPNKRYVVWLIDRSQPTTGPMLWAMPEQKMDKEICQRSKVKTGPSKGQILKITHPEQGYDVSFTMTKQGDWPNYAGVDISREPSPISDDPEQMDKWLDFIADHPLNEVLRWYEDRYIMQVYAGQQERADPDLDEQEEEQTAAEEETTGSEEEPEAATGDELSPESIRAMSEQELGELCEANDLGFDMADYENDLDNARESLVQHFFPGTPEPEPEPAPPPRAKPAAVTRPAATATKPATAQRPAPAAKPNGGGASAAQQAQERLRRMRERSQANA